MASAEDSLGPSAASSSVPALSKRKFLDSIAALDAAVRDPLATTAASLTKRRRTRWVSQYCGALLEPAS